MSWGWNNWNMCSFWKWVTCMSCLLPALPTMLVIIQLICCLTPKILHVSHLTTIIKTKCIFVRMGSDRLCVYQKYPPGLMQPSSSTRVTIVSADNQNGATTVKAIFFFCHYYIVWESTNAGEARGQSWNESIKPRCIPGGLGGLFEWYKAKTFCRAFFAAAMRTIFAAATIVRFPPVIIALK